jgi:limonene-1,2-epoxide hydrolase
MSRRDPVAVVSAWVAAANTQDVDGLLALSDPHIEVAGPRGAGAGHELLREWMARAGLSLETRRVFARGDTVALEQRGTWRSPETGEITGERTLASVFEVDDQRVVRFARYDSLDAALEAAGLRASDELPQAGA